MEQERWKEARREAAKKLGRLGDRKAVPALIQVVETESFDVVAEHAIESLGRLGDERAVPALQRVAQDTSRDRYARELARKALAKLGATPDSGGATVTGGGSAVGGGTSIGSGIGSSTGSGSSAAVPDGPVFADDVLGATEVFQLVTGGASLQWDTVRDQSSLQADARGRYRRDVEKRGKGYTYGADAALAAGAIDPPGDNSSSQALVFDIDADADTRFHWNDGPIYGALEGAAGLSLTAIKVARPGADNNTREFRLGADLHIGIAAGHGRVISVGEALRLRRIELALERARALGRPITPDLAARLMRTWWALRDEQGAHARLVATVKILREAGVLLGEPDASVSYQLLQILLDGQLANRPDGLDVRVGIAESYLVRDDDAPVEDGRVETLFARARYGRQLASTTTEMVGEGFARLRVLADDGEASPWSIGAAAAWRSYVYSDHFDPIGALELVAQVGLSDDDSDQIGLGSRIGGGMGWLWTPNRASQFRLRAEVAVESGELFLGATFEATYGLLDVGFVGPQSYAALKAR
ncbi:MAG TPA: HEAT repeat domain-containing protein [Kofleriaceae bacterium]|nr:HEAT repeat domain-containing protein [Kofleriaceae bacterium]